MDANWQFGDVSAAFEIAWAELQLLATGVSAVTLSLSLSLAGDVEMHDERRLPPSCS